MPCFLLPCSSRVTPDCTAIVSMTGGCPCCSFEKPSANSDSVFASLPVFLCPRPRPVLLVFVGLSGGLSSLPVMLCVVFIRSSCVVLMPVPPMRPRWSFLIAKPNASCTLGSRSDLNSSTQTMLPSVSKVCGLFDISSWSACTLRRSSSLLFSISLALRSLSRRRASSWPLASRSRSSSSSSALSSASGNARGFTSAFLSDLADFPRSDMRDRALAPILRMSPVLDSLLEAAVPGTASLMTCLRTGRCMRAQLSISLGSGSSSSSQSEPSSPSPSSCVT
mmetsp:Transcript_68461/g.176504  ORF Transcript_68461/g.176504 Transcript_68461/m.176504 type:complete len:279 (+) Transcript_68461:369-1205(+)